MKLLIIFNPGARRGRSRNQLKLLQSELRRRSLEADFLFTAGPGQGMELVGRADLSAFDAVVAAGGDGTLFEVLNGLFLHDAQRRIPMGIIPMGTGNAFARDFGLMPGGLEAAIDRLQAFRVRQVDVAQVTTAHEQYYFLNILGLGFAVDAGLTAQRLKFLGSAAYTAGTLWRSLSLRSQTLVIEADGVRLERQAVFLEVSNSRYTGTHFLIAPGACLDDGLLDITLLNHVTRRRLWRLFPSIYSGRHVHYPEVETFRAKHIRIMQPVAKPLGPDGEFRGQSPAEIRCLQRQLALIC